MQSTTLEQYTRRTNPKNTRDTNRRLSHLLQPIPNKTATNHILTIQPPLYPRHLRKRFQYWTDILYPMYRPTRWLIQRWLGMCKISRDPHTTAATCDRGPTSHFVSRHEGVCTIGKVELFTRTQIEGRSTPDANEICHDQGLTIRYSVAWISRGTVKTYDGV